jgi:hypothetical protein
MSGSLVGGAVPQVAAHMAGSTRPNYEATSDVL